MYNYQNIQAIRHYEDADWAQCTAVWFTILFRFRKMIIERCWFMEVIWWFYVSGDQIRNHFSGLREAENMSLWKLTEAAIATLIIDQEFPPQAVRLSSGIKVIINLNAAISSYGQCCEKSVPRIFLASRRIKIHLSLLIESAPDQWLSHYRPPTAASDEIDNE